MTWMTLATVLLTLAAAGGIVMTWLGRRGRRVNDHPVCRRCGFDLTGRPDTSTRCAECGADLSAKRAIRVGQRERRRGLLATGAGLLLLTLTPLAAVGLMHARGTDVNPYKPTWWLTRDALAGDPAAWAEVQRRLGDGHLSRAQVSALVDDVLAWQADVARPWLTAAGDFVEAARDANLATGATPPVSDEQWARYARQAPQFTFAPRARIRAGDLLPVAVTVKTSRAGSRSRLAAQISRPLQGVPAPRRQSASGPWLPMLGSRGGIDLSASGGQQPITFVTVPPPRAGPEAMDDTERDAMMRFPVAVSERARPNRPVVSWTHAVDIRWVEAPATRPVVELTDAPQLRPAFERALHVNDLLVTGTRSTVAIPFDPGALPMPVAFDVFLRADGREWPAAVVVHNGLAASHVVPGKRLRGQVDGFDADRADLIFRPNPDLAAQYAHDIDRIWGGEVVFRGVRVNNKSRGEREALVRARPTTRPTSAPAAAAQGG